MARINLRKFILEHYKGGVTARDVIREVVTNSIDANATNITVDNLNYFDETCTSHKDLIGGKGVGRLSFLKYAKKVRIYMPAPCIIRHNLSSKQKYDQMIKRGKPPKVAITAIMRKLVVLANVLLRDDRTWTEKPT